MARDGHDRREPAPLSGATRRVLGPLARLAVATSRPRASTACPPPGPAILCPNHISFLDSAFLMLSVPRNISFVGKAEYMDSWKTKYLFPAMGMIPIDRSRRLEVARGALETAEARAAPRRAVRHLPRGHAQPRRRLHRGRTGAARLALEVGAPIFPVGITGTDRIQPPDAKAPKPFGSCCDHDRSADASPSATPPAPNGIGRCGR